MYWLRIYAGKVELISADERHVRYVPSELAKAMVEGGSAEIAHSNGKVRSVRLVRTAATLVRIGEPSARATLGVRFTRWRRLDDSATRVLEFHPRSLYPDPE